MTGTISVQNLGKKYKKYKNKAARIIEWITMGKKYKHDETWVLRGLNFEIESGQAVGIVGQNGAGKSTLLKMLTGTAAPTVGHISVSGKVAALLELGMGFHPDFTGRQNVYITGQLMGLNNEEITTLLPEIEAFAEIGQYIDEPLRTYSSGMAVRIAFAAATAIRPDILIVDEALSVGDAYFQQKCFNRIKEFRNEGTTLLFVSHDAAAIKNLCDRAILLDRGTLVKEGKPEEIIDFYNASIAKREAEYQIRQSQGKGTRVTTRSGEGSVKIADVKILSNQNKDICVVQVGDEIDVRVLFESITDISDPTIGILFKDRVGNEIFGTNTYHQGYSIGKVKKNDLNEVSFKIKVNFGLGNYSLTVAIHEGSNHIQKNYDWWDHVKTLQVIAGSENPFVGCCYVSVECSSSKTISSTSEKRSELDNQ
ncbi:ABC transporter ATP-binding protein [Paenibacillus sp. GCM10012303]|uniref:ABC transporter ATP-binding protein n=1 Tax=Paenibacillus sp. GCM10012303 TaxID=3317340 RepID=UPI0036167BEB